MLGDSKIMTKTIQAALSPLLIVSSFCGLGFFEYPFGRSRPYFTYSYFLITWSLYTYLFYYLVYTSYTAYIFMSWFNVIIIITAIVSMFVSLLRFKVKIQNYISFVVSNLIYSNLS